MKKRLYRSRTNKVFAGVCGGFGEYFDVDPVMLRILFVLMVIFGGTGILLYIAAIFIIPKRPIVETEEPEESIPVENRSHAKNWFGYLLIAGGFLLLLANLDLFHFFDFVGNTFEFIFPILLIVLGMAVIYYRQSKPVESEKEVREGEPYESAGQTTVRQFRRSVTDRKIFGVCGGLAAYFGIDSSMMRLLYLILCFASFGAGLILYILLALVVPDDSVMKAKV